jgi:hypothetical protein
VIRHLPWATACAPQRSSWAAETVRGELAASIAAIEGNSRANERERRHAAAARSWLDGDVARAARLWGELLRDHPRDRLALLVNHGLDFRLGHREMLRDRTAAVLPHWDARDAEYGYVLGMHAFGLEETGDYDRALQARMSRSISFPTTQRQSTSSPMCSR